MARSNFYKSVFPMVNAENGEYPLLTARQLVKIMLIDETRSIDLGDSGYVDDGCGEVCRWHKLFSISDIVNQEIQDDAPTWLLGSYGGMGDTQIIKRWDDDDTMTAELTNALDTADLFQFDKDDDSKLLVCVDPNGIEDLLNCLAREITRNERGA